MADGSNRPLGTLPAASTSSAATTPSTTPRLATSVSSPIYFSAAVPQQQLSSPLMLLQQTAVMQQGVVSSENQLHSVRSPAPTATYIPVAHPGAPQYRLIVLNAPVQATSAAAQQQLSTAIRMHQAQQSIMQPSPQTVITAHQQNVVMPLSSVSPASGLSSPPVVFSPHQQPQQQQQQSLNLVNLAAARAALPQQIAAAAAAAQTNAMIASGLRTAMFASANSGQQQNSAAALLNQQQALVALAAVQQQQQQQLAAAASRQFVLMPDGRSYSALTTVDGNGPRATAGVNISTAQPVVSTAGLPFVCFAAPSGGSSPFPSMGATPSNILAAPSRLPTSFQQQPLQMQSFSVGSTSSLGSQPILLTPIGATSTAVSVAGQRMSNVAYSSGGTPTSVNLQQTTLPDGRRAFINTNSLTPVSSPPVISFMQQDPSRPQTFLYQQHAHQPMQVIEQQIISSILSTSAVAVDNNSIKAETLEKQEPMPTETVDDSLLHSVSPFTLPAKRPASVVSAATEPGYAGAGKKARTSKRFAKDSGFNRDRQLPASNVDGDYGMHIRDSIGTATMTSSASWGRPASIPVVPRKPRPVLTKPLNDDGTEETDTDRVCRLKRLHDTVSRLPPQRLKWLLHLLSTNNLKLLRYLSVVSRSIVECEREINEKSSDNEQLTLLRYDLGRLIRQRSLAEQIITRAAQEPEVTIRHLMHPNDWQRLLAMMRKVSDPEYSDEGDNALTAEERFLLDQYEFYIKSFEQARNHPAVMQNYFESAVSSAEEKLTINNQHSRRRRRRSGSSSDAADGHATGNSISNQPPAFHVFIQLSRSSTATLRTGYPFRLQPRTCVDASAVDSETHETNHNADRAVIDRLFVTQIEPDGDDVASEKRELGGKNRPGNRNKQPPYKAILVAQVHVPSDAQSSSETFNSFVETVLHKFYSKSVAPGTLIRYRYADDMIDNETTEILKTTTNSELPKLDRTAFAINENLDNVRKIIWDPDEAHWREMIIIPAAPDAVANQSTASLAGSMPNTTRRHRPPPLLSGDNALPRVLKVPPIADRIEMGQVRPHSVVEQAMDADYETLLASMCGSGSSRTAVTNGSVGSSAVNSVGGGSSTTLTGNDVNGNGGGTATNGTGTAAAGNGSNGGSMLISALRSEPLVATLQNDVRRVCEPFWLVDADMANDRAWIRSVADRLNRHTAIAGDLSIDTKRIGELARAVDLCGDRDLNCARQLRLVGKSLKEFDLQLNRGVGVLKTYRRRRPERVRKAVKKFEVED